MATKVLLSENLKYHLLCKQDTLVKPCGNQRFSHPIKCQLLPVSEESRRLNYGCDLGPTYQITKRSNKKIFEKYSLRPSSANSSYRYLVNEGRIMATSYLAFSWCDESNWYKTFLPRNFWFIWGKFWKYEENLTAFRMSNISIKMGETFCWNPSTSPTKIYNIGLRVFEDAAALEHATNYLPPWMRDFFFLSWKIYFSRLKRFAKWML